jgi:Ca-dependent carbohydrate-binding module xylan-binding/Right handed beta helix region
MSTITFTAYSSLAKGIGAHVNVIVDGRKVGSTYVSSTTKSYAFKANLIPNTAHDVKLVYDNDTVVNGADRNLHLKSINVAGHAVAATSRYEVYHALAQGNLASTGNMYWKGTAEFKLPASMFGGVKPTPAPATQFYVSTTGSDSANGSATHPFKTLAKALSAMKGSSIHTTFVEGGTYNMTSTLTLGAADSGMAFRASPLSPAMLDGGGDLTTLIQLNGATGVTLQGLTFQNTNLRGRAAVVLNGASGNRILGNHFAHNGEGLLLDNHSNHNIVSGNELNNSASSAVEVQQGSSNNRFDSNVVNGTGAIGTQGGGFFLHGANNNTISHNLVENTAGIGIGVENWDSSTVNVGNVITGNIVQNSNTSALSTDSGAIYELGRSNINTKSIISGNYISGPNQAAASGAHIIGIYLDDNASGVQVTNNIVANTISNSVQIHGGNNVTLTNNIFDLGANGLSAILFQGRAPDGGGASMTNDVAKQNIIVSSSANPTAFSDIDGGTPTIGSNFFMDLVNSNFRTNGLAQTNAHFGNAAFVNEAAGNYALGSNSGATAIGFVPINQASMGLHATTAHWYA